MDSDDEVNEQHLQFQEKDYVENYTQYRPNYAPEIYTEIKKYCEEVGTDQFDLALDAACGPGLSTVPLKQCYQQVMGVDVSPAQYMKAPRHMDGIFFRVGPAEKLGFISDSTVDLVTCAQAVHWLDRPAFYKEVHRVLKARGVLALYAYGDMEMDCDESKEILQQFYKEASVDGFCSPDLTTIDDLYNNVDFPYDDVKRVDGITIHHSWTIPHIIGYFKSIPKYRNVLKIHPDTLDNLKSRIEEAYKKKYGDINEDTRVKITWKMVLLLGHKPCVHFY